MTEATTPESAPAPGGHPPKRPRADQDQKMANDIAEWGKVITTATGDADINAALAERGYDAAEFAKGKALQKAAEEAFARRQTAWAGQLAATQTAKDQFTTANDEYVAFRGLARELFPDAASQTALGVSGRVPQDLEKFITISKASYAAAKTAPYTEKLTKRGYPAAKLDGLSGALDVLAKAGADQDKAEGAAKTATEARDAAFAEFKTWMKEFKATAKSALRKEAGLRKKLAL